MLPILTSTVAALPLLFMGSLIAESFFGIPGLGSYTIDAINAQDFSIVRAMVFLGASLYIVGLILADISYTLADPACVSSSRHAQDRLALDRYRALADGVGGAGLRLVRAPQSGAARHLGRVARDTPAMCSAVILAAFVIVGLLDSVHYRPLLPPAPGAPADAARLRAGRALGAGRAAGRQRVDAARENLFHAAGGAPVHQGNHAGGRQAGARFPAAARCGQAPGRSGPRPSRRCAQAPRPGAGGRPGGRAGRHVPADGLPGAPARRRRAAAAEVLGARRTAVARHEPDLCFAVHGGGRVDRAVHRLSRAGHRPHRQRRAVAGLEEHPHGVGHRQPDHAGHAAGHRVRHLGRLFQGQGRRRHPVPVHHHHLDPGRAAGGGLRADDAGLYRQPRRAVRHLGRARRSAPVPAVHDPGPDRLVRLCRLLRAETLKLRELEYVQAARPSACRTGAS